MLSRRSKKYFVNCLFAFVVVLLRLLLRVAPNAAAFGLVRVANAVAGSANGSTADCCAASACPPMAWAMCAEESAMALALAYSNFFFASPALAIAAAAAVHAHLALLPDSPRAVVLAALQPPDSLVQAADWSRALVAQQVVPSALARPVDCASRALLRPAKRFARPPQRAFAALAVANVAELPAGACRRSCCETRCAVALDLAAIAPPQHLLAAAVAAVVVAAVAAVAVVAAIVLETCDAAWPAARAIAGTGLVQRAAFVQSRSLAQRVDIVAADTPVVAADCEMRQMWAVPVQDWQRPTLASPAAQFWRASFRSLPSPNYSDGN